MRFGQFLNWVPPIHRKLCLGFEPSYERYVGCGNGVMKFCLSLSEMIGFYAFRWSDASPPSLTSFRSLPGQARAGLSAVQTGTWNLCSLLGTTGYGGPAGATLWLSEIIGFYQIRIQWTISLPSKPRIAQLSRGQRPQQLCTRCGNGHDPSTRTSSSLVTLGAPVIQDHWILLDSAAPLVRQAVAS